MKKIGKSSRKGKAITELQSMATEVVTGGSANTSLLCNGITTKSHILSAIRFASGVPSNILAEASIPEDGYVSFSTTSTAGNTILVTFIP